MSEILPYLGILGSACVVFTTLLVNYFNRRRNPPQPVEVVETPPVIETPTPIPHSRSYDEMKSFYNELKHRHNNSPPTVHFDI